MPLVSQQSGLIAQHVGRPRDPSSTEYLYVTVWEDVDSIRAFAGERWQEAVIAPDEEHLLKDTWIGHYDALRLPQARNDLRGVKRSVAARRGAQARHVEGRSVV